MEISRYGKYTVFFYYAVEKRKLWRQHRAAMKELKGSPTFDRYIHVYIVWKVDY